MIKFCQDCKYSLPEKNSTWNLLCRHPRILSKDSYALSSPSREGVSARQERKKRFTIFGCGMRGALWEKRPVGETTKQMLDAPENAYFVWYNDELAYPTKLAAFLGREDLVILKKSSAIPSNESFVFDHRVIHGE